MTAVGLAAAVTVWNAPRGTFEQTTDPGPPVADVVSEATDEYTTSLAFVEQSTSDAGQVHATAAPAGEPLKPRVYKIVEGDTLRSIADEYSISISTILASNNLDDPNLISPGQEILIPPIEGVVADVEPNETLAQVAERFGVETADIAQVNALPVQSDVVVPYERIVVPGMETAERALSGGPRRQARTEKLAIQEDLDPAVATKPSGLTYEVQEGDSVAQLATQFGVSVWTILTANSLSDAALIRPGMELKVLPVNGVEHEIQPGESLSDIAAFYKVDLGPLVDFNAIDDPDNLKVGSVITIPGAERAQPGFSLAQVGAPATTAAGSGPTAA
ncbi:MAG: LysM peptidoglycan-binding domain-containing protein, partial [Chloroflexota bacterium]|nr:LysM peptidoglycan-binding domain-containing protein [Chloroflexota bacterium]